MRHCITGNRGLSHNSVIGRVWQTIMLCKTGLETAAKAGPDFRFWAGQNGRLYTG